MNKIKLMLCLLLPALLLSAAGCAGDRKTAPQALTKVTVVLDWYPNTNHTGLYVAKDKGFYEQQGLAVEIIQPGQGSTADRLVAAGKADFGISYQESVTQARARGIPLVSIAAVLQHNTSAFASLKEANITSPRDFAGKRYGGWGSPVEEAVIKAVMEKAGGDPAKVKYVTLGATDFFASIGRDADFEWIYYGWDGIEAKRRGLDLNLIMLKDLDPALDYYTPVIVTGEKHIAEQKELVKKFMAATARGYEWSIEHPAEAADILLKNAPELNAELVKASQAWVSRQYRAAAPRWGVQREEVWARYANWMFERQLIPQNIDVKQAFTNQFLPETP
ncbi:ABC transporter substrate-binding protein [Desulforamulus hydrothermalis]|uniref:Membrane lipoprotein lipid attachment site n=1 Tax=Desulforamulus hydrothermalis Lam5 = DSM 18033 TaxID=1121428 RepID=K8E9Y0_9FIRM|nr:ABC transporter substrate-binding protein [Desulforamulus hydrothermalis]CCO08378.1 Membrane lipoprotein lipid attachment site [Desulforamulus hydrothermalis Lam5 = DSM 18033]SHH14237.1 ABC-type nitrate/sulfonate/bicarbonate transport system, substrate-binding protein [Desulforamulus hydrothermalis Lam5 = DSM 18033]